MMSFVTGALTGLGFGVVLYKVGATRYSRIMGMLTLRDTKVMKFAFMAIATGSFLYGLAATLGVSEQWGLVPRVMPFLGWAHVLGGVLFGAALGVTGYCPGTCAAKAGGRGGEHKFGATAALVGLFVGILLYSAVKAPLTGWGLIAENQKPITLHGLLGMPYGPVAMVFGATLLFITLLVNRVTPEMAYPTVKERRTVLDYVRGEWSWLASGLLGGTLVVVATAQGGYLGFSGAALALVGWGADAIGHPLALVPRVTDDIVWRAALMVGVIPGGLLARAFSLPSQAAATAPAPKVFVPRALARSFAAGLVLSLGAMIGGGCTTGAFIAAWPTLSVGSLAMAGTFFVTSMAVSNARLLGRRFDLREVQLAGDRVYD